MNMQPDYNDGVAVIYSVDDNSAPMVWVGEDAEKRATAWMLHTTSEIRDYDEWPNDEEWLEIVWQEGHWVLVTAGNM